MIYYRLWIFIGERGCGFFMEFLKVFETVFQSESAANHSLPRVYVKCWLEFQSSHKFFIGPTFLPFNPLKFSKIQRKCRNIGLYPVGMDSDLLIYVLLSVF